jgi:hypothetical protein
LRIKEQAAQQRRPHNGTDNPTSKALPGEALPAVLSSTYSPLNNLGNDFVGSGSVWVVISTSYWNCERAEREAISLAPWLQPVIKFYKMIPEPFPTVSPDPPVNKNR